MVQLKLFFLSLPVLAVLDYLWLGLLMSGFYNRELGALARRGADGSLQPHWGSAIVVYLLLALGLSVFVLSRSSPWAIMVRGLLFGLVVYGVYDLTNYATLAGWSAKVVLIDVLWGMTLGALSGVITDYFARLLRIY